MQILAQYPLRKLNTFGVNSIARYFIRVTSDLEIRELTSTPPYLRNEKFILGGGSNLLLTEDINGLVLKNDIKGIHKIREDALYVWIKAGAGESWHDLVLFSLGQGLAGLENLSLIPGSVGAAPMQNIGAYGVEIKDVFEELEAMDLQDGQVKRFTLKDCDFGYRDSIFKHKDRGRFIILSVTLRLNRIPKVNISYGTLASELEAMGVLEITPKAVSQAVIKIRSSKLPDPALIGNAGSFFKNPGVSLTALKELQALFPGLVAYPAHHGVAKLAAGWLIEQCGWKGYREGDAGVHPLQALVLVNYGKAGGKEILELSRRISRSVEDKFGILLEREVNVW
ncbi:MAG TPA: UDP-N-acetylmuramate dehydrogenase [Chitinophagaceae bacterium]|nr:UDP-N-acetylmuramate dehydrogenase [Chitinophagaceae bacterium]